MSNDEAANVRVGLIGIGLLGKALAERFLGAGISLDGYDPSTPAMESLKTLGGQAATGPQDLAIRCQYLVLCLPNSEVVESVLTELQPQLRQDTFIIDTTTGDPRQTHEWSESLSAAGVELIDASVLGSSEVARQGEAVLMVGGSDSAVNHCLPVLRAITGSIHHVGKAGSGQQMKLVANLVLGLNRAALAEGLHFADCLGLNLQAVLTVLKSGAAYSQVMDAKGEKMIDRQFAPQARLSQHLKDVRLILNTASDAGTQLPLSELHRELLQRVEDDGNGDLDNSAVIQAWRSSKR